MTHIKYILIFGLISLFSLQSCFVARNYQQPTVVNEAQYRTDQLPSDSISIAELSYTELFTDPLLIRHISKGLENNIDIRIAVQQILAAEAYFKQGKAGYLPSIGASGQVAYQNPSENSPTGAAVGRSLTQYELSVGASWEADIWGKIRSNKRAFEASYLQTVAAHKVVKTQLIASIASVYYRLLSFDEQLRITEMTIANRKSSLETTKALKEAGYVNEVGVKQTEAQLYSAMALLVDIKTNIKLLENTMSILLGEAPQSIQRGSLKEQEILEEVKVGFPVQLLRNRPDVLAAEYKLINAFELTNVARSNFYPSLNISANGGLQSLELADLLDANSLFSSAVGSLAQPIFNGRRVRTQHEVAKVQQEQALLNFKLSILNAGKEVSDALYTFKAAEERIEIKSREFEAYDLATGYSEELLNNGLINYLEVITARQNALFSQLDLINAQFTQLNALVEIYRSLGGGWQ
ncbi:efflux transporter, outer membrane factor (OMF) lipoprotein, NodT family [Saccharicrinis carchari]|uniref:Efflux transporter, outer membrane factor (OMF) lipoprotein, NodT family n=1 Tax=Saccharicrinis carchari TaxID=1168039 RepID=A0A521CZC4_SACCC|nr:TolC family protein [Saccharicrinis carchari]SMO64101.1 efflux transporter, outer membrane factor (OMF) lipoprotein, NodT family [Saccharicrinis carchari]